MKRVMSLILLVGGAVFMVWFIRQLNTGSDGAWMALGVISTLVIYLVFSLMDLFRDRMRARWIQADLANRAMQTNFNDLVQVSRAQGHFLSNEQRIKRLSPPQNDVFTYEDALAGDVLEYDVDINASN